MLLFDNQVSKLVKSRLEYGWSVPRGIKPRPPAYEAQMLTKQLSVHCRLLYISYINYIFHTLISNFVDFMGKGHKQERKKLEWHLVFQIKGQGFCRISRMKEKRFFAPLSFSIIFFPLIIRPTSSVLIRCCVMQYCSAK